MKKECQKIATTVIPLFTQKGMRSISVEEIARNCGISKRTFYEYFKSKEELVGYIVEDWIKKSARYLSLNRHISSNAISEMNNFFLSMEKVIQTIPPLFFLELRRYYVDIWKVLEHFKEEHLMPFLILNIERGKSENIYRSNIDLYLIGQLYFSLLEGMLENLWRKGIAIEKAYREMNFFLLHGFVNLKGMKLIYEKAIM